MISKDMMELTLAIITKTMFGTDIEDGHERVGKHLEIANRVRAEVAAVCKGKAPTYKEAMELSYTRHVILESMRMYPPAYLFGRVAVEDVTIGSVTIKKGETAMLEAVILLATLMKHYTFSSPENESLVEFEPLITLRPKFGLELNVEKRV